MRITVIQITKVVKGETGVDFEQADALNGSIRLIAIKHRALAAAALGELGLHPGHEAVLLALHAHGPQTQAQLAQRAGCEPPSITGMVRKLEAAGLLDRHPAPGNARATIVDLTEAGRALVPKLKALWVRLAEDTVAAIPGVDVNRLAATLADLAESLRRARLR